MLFELLILDVISFISTIKKFLIKVNTKIKNILPLSNNSLRKNINIAKLNLFLVYSYTEMHILIYFLIK